MEVLALEDDLSPVLLPFDYVNRPEPLRGVGHDLPPVRRGGEVSSARKRHAGAAIDRLRAAEPRRLTTNRTNYTNGTGTDER